jgi:hypothetical protein
MQNNMFYLSFVSFLSIILPPVCPPVLLAPRLRGGKLESMRLSSTSDTGTILFPNGM